MFSTEINGIPFCTNVSSEELRKLSIHNQQSQDSNSDFLDTNLQALNHCVINPTERDALKMCTGLSSMKRPLHSWGIPEYNPRAPLPGLAQPKWKSQDFSFSKSQCELSLSMLLLLL